MSYVPIYCDRSVLDGHAEDRPVFERMLIDSGYASGKLWQEAMRHTKNKDGQPSRILFDWNEQRDKMWNMAMSLFHIQQNYATRRVQSFRSPQEIETLPPSIGQLQALRELYLTNTKALRNLPEEIGNLGNLTKINLFGSGLRVLPPSIGQLNSLQHLDLRCVDELTSLPEEIGNLSNLIHLDLSWTGVTSLPSSIGRLQSLEELYLTGTKALSNLPEEIGNLAKTFHLDLGYSGVTSLPRSIGQLQALQELVLCHTKLLSNVPEDIANLGNLIELNLSCSGVRSLPQYIHHLPALKYLDLSGLRKLARVNLSGFRKLIKLNFNYTWVSFLPPCNGILQSLEELSLQGSTSLKNLPEDIGNLGNLIKLDLSWTGITSLPPSIGQLQALQHLSLYKTTQLKKLPEEIGNLRNLILLDLAGSGITFIPPSIQNALARNRYRSRVVKAKMKKRFVSTAGWPFMLENAAYASRPEDGNNHFIESDSDSNNASDIFLRNTTSNRLRGLESHEAMYRLLKDYREPFVKMLINRNAERSPKKQRLESYQAPS